MKRNDLQPWQVALMAWIFTLLSLICAFLIFVFPSSQYVRREFGSIGFMSGVVRHDDRRLGCAKDM